MFDISATKPATLSLMPPTSRSSARAGLSMRLARQIQLRLAQVPPKDVLNPRESTLYPLSDRDMVWQLEFFGIS